VGGRFYSPDAQAGRPVMIVALGALAPAEARATVAQLVAVRPMLERCGVDLVALASLAGDNAWALADSDLVIFVGDDGGIERLEVEGRPGLLVLDRGWRIVHMGAFEPRTNLLTLIAHLRSQLAPEPARTCSHTAPVLIVPNVLPQGICRTLIRHFESQPHDAGLLAAVDRDRGRIDRLDEDKKLRRDLGLSPGLALHGEVMRVLAERLAPEVKRAFRFEAAFADRILIARYDDSGGYFRRHRDDAAPHTAFRDFAVSINLNTGEYEGGELMFPEYDDHRYSPPAGAAIVFSAALLHEAAPVRRGRRYVALSFLCGAQGEAKRAAAG
jgi:predicted 2-oxoglutarate/Fe(II)-dependent dioxygenase YbiX